MAQANNANRQTRKMNAALDGAFQSGNQPSQNKNLAIVVRAPNRKRFTLVTKEGQVTEAGKYWYEQLHQVSAPTIYRYEQRLINDTHVETWDGRRIKVRQHNKKDNTWTILKPGINYFKYNRSEFLIEAIMLMRE